MERGGCFNLCMAGNRTENGCGEPLQMAEEWNVKMCSRLQLAEEWNVKVCSRLQSSGM